MAAASALTSTTYPMPKTNPINLKLLHPTCNVLKFQSFNNACKQRNLSAALQSFSILFTSKTRPTDEAYAALTELCSTMSNLSLAHQIHAHCIITGAVSNSVFLNTKFVLMYSKCGAFDNADKVFAEMQHRNVYTWNAMIGACVSSGQYLKGVGLYKGMRECGVSLDAYSFPSLLKGCGALGDLMIGGEIHGLAIKYGCDTVGFVVNALVAMYSKCGDIRGARLLFHQIVEKDDVVLWNSMISAYSCRGLATEAVSVFREMQSGGVAANAYTLVSTLQACEQQSYWRLGQQIHAFVLRSGCYLDDVYVDNALLAFYARFGDMSRAAHIFHDMNQRDLVSWNTMLTGLAENGLHRDVIIFFQDMLDEGLKPDQVSVLSVTMAAGRLGNLLNGKEVHGYALKHGLDRDLQVGNTLLDMYSKCSSVVYMSRLYDVMDLNDFVSKTTVIAGYVHNNCCLKALELYREVHTGFQEVDPLMIGCLLLACKGLKSVSHLKQTHAYIIRRGVSDLTLPNAILDVYGECELIQYAVRAFKLIESKDMVTWTSLITCYANNGLPNEALEVFADMMHSGLEPDFVVLVSLLSAVTSVSSLRKGKEIHGFMLRKGISVEGSVLNSLLDMYANCGSLEHSCSLFDRFRKNDLVLWTCMINAYGMHGHGYAAIDLFKRMGNHNLWPDHVTFLALLQACSHSGLIDEGQKYFKTMTSKYELTPWPEHYVCLVDLLGRANHLDEAYQYVLTMKIEPTSEIWCSLLNSCKIHSNEKIGNIAAEKLLRLNPVNPGNYVLVSNLYASKQRWNEVDKVRMKMKDKELNKSPGCSWVEMSNMVHTFTAGDCSHPESDKIYQKLTEVTKKLTEEEGYVAQTSYVTQNVTQEEKADILHTHSERLAIAYSLITTSETMPIRITKNLRVCGDCHNFCKLVSKLYNRDLIIRDAKRFHHFSHGECSCGDFW